MPSKTSPTTKRTSVKKVTVKPKTSKKRVALSQKTKASQASIKTAHLKLCKEPEDFFVLRINRETLYWAVLGVVVILFTIWVLKLQSDVMTAYDQIDANTASIDDIRSTAKKQN